MLNLTIIFGKKKKKISMKLIFNQTIKINLLMKMKIKFNKMLSKMGLKLKI